MTFFVMLVAFACLFPLGACALCRAQVAVPVALITGAMTAGLLTATELPHPFYLALEAWMLLISGLCSWHRSIWYGPQDSAAFRPAAQTWSKAPADTLQD
ncbi:hypothetical protein ASF77_11175 [Massilia sp. Leaf139]|nr:hypothetical protein ASF77_11175 [Massilia sp. Leaf139]